jgi:hypothetical protein
VTFQDLRLGIALKDLGPSQLAYYLVRNANRFLAQTSGVDVIAFVAAQASRPLPANFAVMPTYEMWGYDGVVVATDFSSAQLLQSSPAPCRKFFYVWDLEWCRPHLYRPYRQWADVYRDKDLTLLARGPDHARAIEEAFNVKVKGLVNNLDFKQLFKQLWQVTE